MRELTILLDMDGILADLTTPWFAAYNRRTGDSLRLEDVHEWEVSKFARKGDVYAPLRDPGMFRNLKPLPGALEAVRALHDEGHRVVIVTACLGSTQTGAYEKKQWVKEYLPFLDPKDMVVTASKDLVRGNVFIDDGPHNLKAFRDANPYAFIATIAYPYNGPAALEHCDLIAHDYRNTAMAWAQLLAGIRDFSRKMTPVVPWSPS